MNTFRPGDPLRKEIRRDLRQLDAARIGDVIATEKDKVRAAAMAELTAAGDARGLSPEEYRKAKARMLTLTRRAIQPRP